MSSGHRDLLQEAVKAAQSRLGAEAAKLALASPLADGILVGLRRRWPTLPQSVLEQGVAQAIEAMIIQAANGKRFARPEDFIFKAAHRRVIDAYKNRAWVNQESQYESDSQILAGAPGPEQNDEDEEREADVRRLRAIGLAREYLPRLGQGQVEQVMRLVIEAAEKRVEDLPASEVGEILGIPANQVRALINRGLRRLGDLAKADGIQDDMVLLDPVAPDDDLPAA